VPKKRTLKRDTVTFIEEARRAQIIDATITTMARIGFVNTSLSEVAKEAGISKGIIPYYFGSKDELVRASLDFLLEREDDFLHERVEPEPTATGKLRAFIDASFDYMRTHVTESLAFNELSSSFDSREARAGFTKSVFGPACDYIAGIIRQGQASDEFCEGPPEIFAALTMAVMDGLWRQWTFDPDSVNLAECQAWSRRLLEGLVLEPDRP